MEENSIHKIIKLLQNLPKDFQKNNINVLSEIFGLLEHLETVFDKQYQISKPSTHFTSRSETTSNIPQISVQSNADAQKLQKDLLKYLRRTRSSMVRIDHKKIIEDH
ncbi:hypothetical protein [Candidatus Lokiarchaeum ossiferum]|uniref:hypothetical protein n=1 Tax=Candidatus Lokiarchaeum ossiferum TaxID=2951803 RepID=UPI00352E2FC4